MYIEVRLREGQVVKDLGIRNDKIIPFVNEFLVKLSAKILKDEEIQRDINMLTTSMGISFNDTVESYINVKIFYILLIHCAKCNYLFFIEWCVDGWR